MIAPVKILSSLDWSLVLGGDSRLDAVTRRVIQDEATTLRVAIESGDGERIRKAADEAVRVAKMYGVSVAR